MSLTTLEELVAQLSADTPNVDRVLQKLLDVTDLSTFSVGIGINIVVGGSVIRGTLITPGRFARRLDHTLSTGLNDALSGYGDDSVEREAAEAWRDGMAGVFEGYAQSVQDLEKEHGDQLEKIAHEKGVDPQDLKDEDLPDDVALTAIGLSAPRPALALEKAVIAGPPSFVEHEIGTVRIQTAQIEAWWLSGMADTDPPPPEPTD